MRILLQLKTRQLQDWTDRKINPDNINPKNYPYRERLLGLLKDHEIYEIDGPIPLQKSKELIQWADKIICIDSFLQHLCWYMDRLAIVLWGTSDPLIFGHKENINLLKDRKYLREKQFWKWEQAPYIPEAFVEPETVLQYIREDK